MIPSLLIAITLAAAPPLQQVRRQLTHEYERVGRTAPLLDPALDRAAQTVARAALSLRASQAAAPEAIADAVSDAGGFDPSPRAIVVRADPPESALSAFLARTDLPSDAANTAGAAWAEDGEHGVAVVLLAQRKVSLAPFPHQLAKPSDAQRLCGAFTAPLRRPELFLTSPSGKVARIEPRLEGGRFCGALRFPAEGRYTVEVLATGAAGPEVVAIFHVDVGVRAARRADAEPDEPATPALARARILERVNALRATQGEVALAPDRDLEKVAQAYADQMAREHFFAHVDPAGNTLAARLRGGGVLYQRAGENLGLAPGPLAAAAGIERSPGHRKNLLDPSFTRLGVGIATEHLVGRDQVLVVEVMANAAEPAPHGATAAALVADAIQRKRRELHLPPLRHRPELDRIALERARDAIAVDSVDVPPPEPVEPKVFRAVPEAHRAAVDLLVTSDARAVPPSRALADPANDAFGFAAVPASSRRYGPDEIWVVVIYASTR